MTATWHQAQSMGSLGLAVSTIQVMTGWQSTLQEIASSEPGEILAKQQSGRTRGHALEYCLRWWPVMAQ